MRKYDQLTEDERGAAVEKATESLLHAIMEGMRFNDALNGDTLQARIDKAWKEAEDMQTPWFAGEYIMEYAGEDIRRMAEADAEDALYPSPDERIIRL